MGMGRPLQGGSGTPVSTDAQVSYPLHKVHCWSITSSRKESLGTSDFSSTSLFPGPSSSELLPFLMVAEVVL